MIDNIELMYYYIYMLINLKNIFRNEHVNIDDVIQLIHTNKLNCISLQLLKEERITEMYYLIQLVGILSVHFQDNTNIRNHKIIFGSFFSYQPINIQEKLIDDTNKCLQNFLKKIEKHKITFIGETKNFNKQELLSYILENKVLK